MLRGFIYAVLAACSYGLIGLFSVPLMQEGLSLSTVNFYRFALAAFMVMIFVLVRKRSVKALYVCTSDVVKFLVVSLFYALTVMTVMAAFLVMDTGVVIAVQYCYPLFVVFCMVAFFGERFRLSTVMASLLITVGVAVFSMQDMFFGSSGVNITTWGMTLTLLCALFMALYVLGIQVAKFSCQSEFVTAMYIMWGTALYSALYGCIMGDFDPFVSAQQLQELSLLAFITGVVANICLVFAVRYVGSSLTSILGGLEPVTCMLAGIYFLGEQASWANVLGTACILGAVTLVGVAAQLRR